VCTAAVNRHLSRQTNGAEYTSTVCERARKREREREEEYVCVCAQPWRIVAYLYRRMERISCPLRVRERERQKERERECTQPRRIVAYLGIQMKLITHPLCVCARYTFTACV